MADSSFTGHRRQRKTPRSVARAEFIARSLIYAGGFGTIAAILLIFGFLVSVVMPLFGGAEADDGRVIVERATNARVIGVGSDEYRTIAWSLHADGTVRTREFRTGRTARS